MCGNLPDVIDKVSVDFNAMIGKAKEGNFRTMIHSFPLEFSLFLSLFDGKKEKSVKFVTSVFFSFLSFPLYLCDGFYNRKFVVFCSSDSLT
jgi:hypothetical protein